MRTKNYIFTLFLCLGTQTLIGQADDAKIISLNVGSAAALGDFGNQDPNNADAGGAGSGLSFDLGLKMDGTEDLKNFGLNLLMKLQVNPVGQEYADAFVNELGSGTTATFGTYSLTGYMIGTHYNIRIGDNFKIQPKVLLGYMDAKSPQIDVSFMGAKVAQITRGETSTFAALLGADIGYDIGKFRIQAAYDYVVASPSYNVKLVSATTGTSEDRVWKQSLVTYNFSIGLGYHILE